MMETLKDSIYEMPDRTLIYRTFKLHLRSPGLKAFMLPLINNTDVIAELLYTDNH